MATEWSSVKKRREVGSAKYIVRLYDYCCIYFPNKNVFDESDYSRVDQIKWLGSKFTPHLMFVKFDNLYKGFKEIFTVDGGNPIDFLPAICGTSASVMNNRLRDDKNYAKYVLAEMTNLGIPLGRFIENIFWLMQVIPKNGYNQYLFNRAFEMHDVRFNLVSRIQGCNFNHLLIGVYSDEIMRVGKSRNKHGSDVFEAISSPSHFLKEAIDSNRYQEELTKVCNKWRKKFDKWIASYNEKDFPSAEEINNLANDLLDICIDISFYGGDSYSHNLVENEEYALGSIFKDYPKAIAFNDFRNIPKLRENKYYNESGIMLSIQQSFMGNPLILACILRDAVGANKVEHDIHMNALVLTFDMRIWFKDWSSSYKIDLDSELLNNLLPYLRYAFAHPMLVKKTGVNLTASEIKSDKIEIIFNEDSGTIKAVYRLNS